MPLSNSMCHGNKSGIVRWMYKLWILIPWEEMNSSENFSCNVSLQARSKEFKIGTARLDDEGGGVN